MKTTNTMPINASIAVALSSVLEVVFAVGKEVVDAREDYYNEQYGEEIHGFTLTFYIANIAKNIHISCICFLSKPHKLFSKSKAAINESNSQVLRSSIVCF